MKYGVKERKFIFDALNGYVNKEQELGRKNKTGAWTTPPQLWNVKMTKPISPSAPPVAQSSAQR